MNTPLNTTNTTTAPTPTSMPEVPTPTPTLPMNPVPPTQQPSVPSHKGSWRVIAAAILLLIAIVGGGAGLYLSQRSAETRQQAYEPPSIPPELAQYAPKTPVPQIPSPVPSPTTPQPGAETQRTNAFKTLPVMKVGTNTGEVSGLVCKYGNSYPSGTVVFFNVDQQSIVQTQIAANQNVYTTKLPPGNFVAFFYPDDLTLPPFAYTQYVQCGLDPANCTNHAPLVMNIVGKQQYGKVNLCDPQVTYDGLPNALYQ